MKFSEELRRFRKENNLTQLEVAEMLGITQVTVAQYETSGKVPNVFMGLKIARLLETTVEELFGCNQEQEEQK